MMPTRQRPIRRRLSVAMAVTACLATAAPRFAAPASGAHQPAPTACRLVAVPDQPLVRDRHTCLLASFDAPDASDADYARAERREVGVGSQPDAPGRFGGGVAVTGSAGCVMYPGLDNYDPRRGTVEFWAQSRGDAPIWSDGKEHWLLVLYPERAGAAPRYGMVPTFITLCKTADNALELKVAPTSAPSYAAATTLRAAQGSALTLPVDQLAAPDWHHILCAWDGSTGFLPGQEQQSDVPVHIFGEIAAPDPKAPTGPPACIARAHKGCLGMPAMGRFIEIDFAHKLVQDRRDTRCPTHFCQAASLDDDAHLSTKALNRIREVGRAPTACICVLACQSKQRRANRSQIRRIGGQQGHFDILVGTGAKTLKKRERRPVVDRPDHSAFARSLRSMLTCSHL